MAPVDGITGKILSDGAFSDAQALGGKEDNRCIDHINKIICTSMHVLSLKAPRSCECVQGMQCTERPMMYLHKVIESNLLDPSLHLLRSCQ